MQFIVTSISTPELFGRNSDNSLVDFFTLISDENTPNFLIKDIVGQMVAEDCLNEVGSLCTLTLLSMTMSEFIYKLLYDSLI